MKVLLIEYCDYQSFPMGGQLIFARNVAISLKEDVLLVGIDSSGALPVGQWSELFINGITYKFFNLAYVKPFENKRPLIPSRIRAFLAIKKWIDKILGAPFDKILIQSPEALLALPMKYRLKTIFCSPGVANPLVNARYVCLRFLKSFYDKLFFRFLYSCPLVLAAASREEISDFTNRALTVGYEKVVFQFPTRYDDGVYFEQSKTECRKSLGMGTNDVIYIAVGRLNWYKGWKLMIDSFSIVSRKIENAKLYFIGEGEDENKIRDYIHQQKLESNVFLCGRLAPPMIALYLNASDAYISASYKEGWSTTLVEACSCNVPCIVTNFSSSYDMIENGINGFVLDSRNDEQFAQSMENAIALDRNNIRKYNRKFSRYAVSKLKDELVNIILNNAR